MNKECPRCKHIDKIEKTNGIVYHTCTKCGTQSISYKTASKESFLNKIKG